MRTYEDTFLHDEGFIIFATYATLSSDIFVENVVGPIDGVSNGLAEGLFVCELDGIGAVIPAGACPGIFPDRLLLVGANDRFKKIPGGSR